MKNTTFRKKALLSSVAMLLVALVALGSATFAWFSSNKVVTANGMEVTAGAAQGLVINKDNQGENNWDNTVSFEQGNESITLTPVSVATPVDKKASELEAFVAGEVQNTTGGTYENSKDDEGNDLVKNFKTADIPTESGAAGVEGFAKNSNFAVYEVAVKSTSGTLKGVKGYIEYKTADGNKAADYIRIAAIDNATGKVLKTFGNDTAGRVITSTTPTVADQALQAITFGEGDTAKANEFLGATDITETAKEYTFLVWFEGEDEDCIDVNQSLTGKFAIKFYY